jgi:hypothetical protein
MNLFILSRSQKRIAKYMIDKHVHKILLEAAQMLCSAVRVLSPDSDFTGIYKLAHKNHPVSIWCRNSRANFEWTLELVEALHQEWQFRHGHTKIHKSYLVCKKLVIPSTFPEEGLTPFAICMPDQYKTDDAIESYRNYYRADKAKMASWKNRDKPYWF